MLPTAAFAQGAGATIAGVVRDTSGAVLPGVTVEVASPALIERVRATVTDGTGQYRIVDLRPGTYSVTAALAGFNTFKRDNVEVSGTGVFTINADLRVGAIEETVTVSGETPVVDLQSTTKERVMSKEVVDALPTGRLYTNLGVLVPGVNSTARDVGGASGVTMGSLTAHGGQTGDQRILQNGLNVMTLQTGGGNIGGSIPNTSAAQEVAIDTSAASAERQTGGVSVNFIPRDGGNTVRGSLFVTGAWEGQQASNFTQELVDQGLTLANKYRQNWDINPGIGGPVLRDKLWYYFTYRDNGALNYAAGMFFNQNQYLPNVWTYLPANGQNGGVARPALANHASFLDAQIRMTWQANPKNKFAGTWDQQWKNEKRGVNATTAPESGVEFRFPVQRLLHAEWWSPITSKVLIEFVALHRTERWGNMHLRPISDKNGSQAVTPAEYALYPSMIGVVQQVGTVGVPNDLTFHGPSGTFNNTWVPNYTYRWAVSYITGAHAFKVGGQDSFGFREATTYLTTLDTQNRPVRYRFASQNTPNQVTAYHTPYLQRENELHDLGLFVQDRWTLDRLTLNGGLRFDYFQSEVPAQTLFASTLGRAQTNFAAIEDTLNWKDWTPRMGAAYDIQGDGKTAIKVTLNKYVAGQALGGLPSSANPIGRLTNSNSRNWDDNAFDATPARGNNDFVLDCNLANPAANGECSNAGNANFAAGSTAIPGANATNDFTGLTDFNVRRGWGVRSYNWEFSAGVQREVMPRVSVDVSYFRRWYGNFTATDNLAVAPSDFKYFSVTAPLDTRLPGGGGYAVTGFTDFTTVAAATATAINRVIFTDDISASQIDHWNGVDVAVNARLQNGLLLQGGTSTGRRSQNTCGVAAALPETLGNNPLEYCDQVEPFRTQLKAVAAYTLPRYEGLPSTLGLMFENLQVAGTFQSIPGDEKTATFAMNTTELTNNSSLGSGLTNGGTKTVALIKPGTVFDERQNQLDIRIGRILRFGRTRTSLNFDIFNVTNDNTVLSRNNSFSKSAGNGSANQVLQADGLAHTLWAPTSILQARFYKLSATFDF
jgi:hypothetical protein